MIFSTMPKIFQRCSKNRSPSVLVFQLDKGCRTRWPLQFNQYFQTKFKHNLLACLKTFVFFDFRSKNYIHNDDRHLQALNNHRKNALNSYELFVESIGKDDPISKNALMLQVGQSNLRKFHNGVTG